MTQQPNNPALEALRLEARDPRTVPDRLKRLASHAHTEVRRAVAANPNTPTNALVWLAARLPEAVLENPILDLLLLENPNWIAELPIYARSSLLSSPKAPAGFLSWAITWGDQATLLAVTTNPKAPSSALERLRDHEDPQVAQAANMHVNLKPPEELPGLLELAQAVELERDREALKDLMAVNAAPAWLLEVLANDLDAEVRTHVAAQPGTPAPTLARLSADDDEEVRKAARDNPNCPAETIALHVKLEANDASLSAADLEQAAAHSTWTLRQCASHPKLGAAILERLVGDDDWRVRQAVATNPALAAAHLETLARDNDRDVRAAVAANPNATPAILEPLLGDASDDVRERALAHPNVPVHVLEDLERARAGDANLGPKELEALSARGEWARRLVAQHPNMPPEALERDAASDDWHTRQAVARNPNTPLGALQKLGEDSDADVRSAVAANPNVPPALLETLAQDVNHEVRKAVASNVTAPPALLALLADDANWVVRQAVAANRDTPALALERLALDSDRDVKQAVADNPNIPERAIETLFSQWFSSLEGVTGSLLELYRRARSLDPTLPGDVLEQLAQGGEWARLLAARHPATPASALAALAREDDWRVRQAVAQNPSAPHAVLELLLTDGDHDVRTAVVGHANTTPTMLERLAQDGHASVRRAVLERGLLSPAALEHLCVDEDEELRALATQHANAPLAALERYRALEAGDPSLEPEELEHLAHLGLHARKLVARHPNAAVEFLERAAGDESWLVRQATAQNPQVPQVVLERLVHDLDRDVRASLARNPSAPLTVLEQLLLDTDDGVRRGALSNPSLDEPGRAAQRRRLIAHNARSKDTMNRLVGLSHPLLPVRELRKRRNVNSLEWRERLALTANPSLPSDVLEVLAEDANRAVRDAARQALNARQAP